MEPKCDDFTCTAVAEPLSVTAPSRSEIGLPGGVHAPLAAAASVTVVAGRGGELSFSAANSQPSTSRRESLSSLLQATPSQRSFVPLLSAIPTSLRRRSRPSSSALKDHVVNERRDLRRIPCRLRRAGVLLSCLLAVEIVLTLLQEVWLWTQTSPTESSCDEATAEEECSETSPMVVLIVVGKQLIVTVVLLGIQFTRTYQILRHRRQLLRSQKAGTYEGGGKGEDSQVPVDHWTAVASQDIFRETARMVSSSQILVYIMVGASTGVATAAQVRNAITKYSGLEGERLVTDACCPACEPFEEGCPCDRVCRAAYASFSTFLTLNVGTLVCVMSSMIYIPLAIWSPMADSAFRHPDSVRVQHKVLRRTRSVPVPLSILAGMTGACIGVYAGSFIMPTIFVGVGLWWTVILVNVTVSVGAVTLLVWSAGVRRLATLPVYLARVFIHTVRTALSKSSKGFISSEDIESAPARRKPTVSTLWKCRESARYRQLALLVACVYCFAIEALNLRSQGVYELYISRILSLLLLLITRDAEADAANLSVEGAGFGLLVCANQLQRALRAHLRGESFASEKMPRYKATMLRMQETLALSYRWHDDNAIQLGSGLVLSMTRWQVESTLEGISVSRCKYVWIDSLAIPTAFELRKLQKTLLSRMMAVYSAALVTLALRSCEADGDRYHQRIWTLQEFCAAKNLMVLTQPICVGDMCTLTGMRPVLNREDVLVETLRAEHIARHAKIVPVWLADGGPTSIMQSIPSADAHAIWATYQRLASNLHCRYRADAVRALYPLLWNRPAESEPELVALLEALQAVHGIAQDSVVRMLRETHMRESRDEKLGNSLMRSSQSNHAILESNSSFASSLPGNLTEAWSA